MRRVHFWGGPYLKINNPMLFCKICFEGQGELTAISGEFSSKLAVRGR